MYFVAFLHQGKTSPDGKSVTCNHSGESLPVAKGHTFKPNSNEQFWVVEKKRFLRKPLKSALPFADVGYGPVGK